MTNFHDKCKLAECRSCRSRGLTGILDLGLMPLSDGLLTESQLQRGEEFKYPLEVAYCPNCTLVQILDTIEPEKLFCEDYPYYSSFSDTLLEHSRLNVLSMIERRRLSGESFVVELASNDGYLLRNYVENGIPCLGIDPAEGPAKAAAEASVPTLCEFFTEELAEKLAKDEQRADVLHANNVLAHVADTNGFVRGIRTVLKNDGVAVLEVPYVRDLVDHCEFDTIYHEHLCYFSVTSLDYLFRANGLFLNDIERLSIHGGSIRLYVCRYEQVEKSVRGILEEERRLGVDTASYYEDFAEKVRAVRKQIKGLLAGLKAENMSVAAYGAAAKGAIMLNYIGAGTDVIDYVVDRNVHKQGKFMPGVHIPIRDPETLLQNRPDYAMILPWNFKDEIISQQAQYREQGGKFIIPIPKPVTV